jgi:hypothetical protein
MSGHEHEQEHVLEDEETQQGSEEDHDQDSDPSLNAPGDAPPSGVVGDAEDER